MRHPGFLAVGQGLLLFGAAFPVAFLAAFLASSGCARSLPLEHTSGAARAPASSSALAGPERVPAASGSPPGVNAPAANAPASAPTQLEPDGDDAFVPQGDTPRPLRAGQFTRVGRPPLALTRICD